MAGFAQAVAFVQNVLGAQAMAVTGRTFQMVMRFHAKGIGFAMPVQKAQALPGALRDAKNTVGDVGFAVAMDL